MPKAIKKRLKHTEVETEVQDRISDIKKLMREKQKAVIMYGAVAGIAVAVVVGLLFYKYTTDEKARQLEYEAYKIYHNEYQTTPLSKQEQFSTAAALFQQAYAKSKSPRLLLYLASCNAALERYPEATTTLDLFFKNHSGDKGLLPLAYRQAAGIQLKTGNKAAALQNLDALYKLSGDLFKDVALIESARILEDDGKKEEAAAKYRELTEKFKDSPFFNEATAKLGEKKEG
ncbi:MAG: tetratricopeptide repeat protein [Thermodesulfovibrionales bacterium]